MQDWTSTYWFQWQALSNFYWDEPNYVYALVLVPFIFLLRHYIQRRTQVGFPVASINSKIERNWTVYLRFIAPVFMGLFLVFIIIALCRPQLVLNNQNKQSEGIDIALALDVSESMYFTDIKPNRLITAKKFIKQFVNERYQDRIGLVIFAGEAITLSSLTTDYTDLLLNLDRADYKLVGGQGTAIGNAIAVAVHRLNAAKSKTKILILISDGDNTAGNIDPITAAQIAGSYGVKIYSIFVGQPGQAANKESNSLDANQLQKIAEITSGKFLVASSSAQIKNIFDQINRLEKVKFLESTSSTRTDVYHVYVRWALVFLIIAFTTKITFLGNILED